MGIIGAAFGPPRPCHLLSVLFGKVLTLILFGASWCRVEENRYFLPYCPHRRAVESVVTVTTAHEPIVQADWGRGKPSIWQLRMNLLWLES